MYERLVDWILPSTCVMCGTFLPIGDGAICAACRTGLPAIREPRCRHCGTELLSCVDRCTRCRSTDSASTLACRGVFAYDDSLAYLLSRFKGNNDRRLAGWIATELVELCHHEWPSAVAVPIPGSPRNVRRRGWDHMKIVAAALAQRGVATCGLLRRVEGPEQKGLGREARRAAISVSLRVEPGSAVPESASLVIVDDVRTTGATLEAAATLLRGRGLPVAGAAVLGIR